MARPTVIAGINCEITSAYSHTFLGTRCRLTFFYNGIQHNWEECISDLDKVRNPNWQKDLDMVFETYVLRITKSFKGEILSD